jgi:hypothetical protein
VIFASCRRCILTISEYPIQIRRREPGRVHRERAIEPMRCGRVAGPFTTSTSSVSRADE